MTQYSSVPSEIMNIASGLNVGQYKMKCPLCQGERVKHRNDKPLSLNIDSEGVRYYCHHCETEGGWVNKAQQQDEWTWGNMPIVRPIHTDNTNSIAKSYLKQRGLSEEVIEQHTVTGTYRFAGKPVPAVGFPYRAGEVSAVKWRSADTEKHFSQQNVCEDFFLLETVKPGDSIIICEGEMDALAWRSAGLPEGVSVVSVPNGAPKSVKDGRIDPKEDRKFRYVWRARDILERAPRVYLNTDSDDPGKALAEELARRIGRAKSWITTMGTHKDAAEALVTDGPEYLLAQLENSTPVPLTGLIEGDAFVGDYVALYEHGQMRGVNTGLGTLDKLISIPSGMLTVVTGYPGSGKSDLIDQLCVNLSTNYGWKTVFCSFEKPPELHMAQLAEKLIGKPFFKDKGGLSRMTREERDYAQQWIDDNFIFLDYRKGSPGDIDGILDVASAAVMRLGVRALVIDPYNYVEHPTGFSGRETDLISGMLTKVGRWAKQHDAHVFFVAHPAKPQDRSRKVCTGIDISGSMAWFAKADIGITAVRGEDDVNEVYAWKVRWSWMGQPGKAMLGFDPRTSRWYDMDPDVMFDDDYDWDW